MLLLVSHLHPRPRPQCLDLKSYPQHQGWRMHPHGDLLFIRHGEQNHKEIHMHIGHRLQMVLWKHLRKREITSMNWASNFGFIKLKILLQKWSLGQSRNELEYSYSWSPRSTPDLIKRTKLSSLIWTDNYASSVAVTKQRVVASQCDLHHKRRLRAC